MKCPRCHKGDLADYSNLDILNNIAYKKSICAWCGYWEVRSSKDKNYIEKSNYYTLEF